MNKNVFKTLIIIIFLLTFSTGASAGEIPGEGEVLSSAGENPAGDWPVSKIGYLQGFLPDTEYILTSPARWDRSDWIRVSLFAGITAGLFTLDDEIQGWVQRNRSSTGDNIAGLVRPFGDARYTLPSLGLLYLYAQYNDDRKAERTALLGIESLVLSTAFTYTLKFGTHRSRPESGEDSSEWSGPGFSAGDLSFPSQHSSSAFAVATVVASEYKEHALVPPVAYGVALLTALSRVNDNKHWTSDVLFGSVTGYFIARSVINLHSGKKRSRISVLPAIDAGRTALMLSYRF